MEVQAIVKCYHCGHTSGRMAGEYGETLTASNFVPREGYAGIPPAEGEPVRCERCRGPVYLEDLGPVVSLARIKRIRKLRRQLERLNQRKLAGAA